MWHAIAYQPQDLPEMVDLARGFYGDSWISDSEFLRWQYEKNPAGQALIMLARDQDQGVLAGQYIVIPALFQAGEDRITGTLSLNTLTHRDYWGQGIFTGLAKALFERCQEQGLAFTYGFPNPNSYPGFIKKLGFTELGAIPLLLKPLNVRNLVKAKAGSIPAWLSSPFQLLFRVKKKRLREIKITTVTQKSVEELETFWQKIKQKYPLIGVRNAEYLRWRYFDIPLREYKVFAARNSLGYLLGYIVGRCTEVAGMRSGMVADFLLEPGQTQAGEMLVSAILEWFVAQDMDLAGSLMMAHTEEYRVLKKAGFFKCPKFLEPQPFPVIFRQHLPEAKDPLFQRFDNWFLTMGDYDVI